MSEGLCQLADNRRQMAYWTVTEINGMPCTASMLIYPNKNAMFEDMRVRVGLDGLFRCRGPGDYVYRITKNGYDRIAGETPLRQRRDGRRK
jgi:hypothetical protein